MTRYWRYHTKIPTTYAVIAGSVAIFKYVLNVNSGSRVIAIIPEAEPMIRMDPPVPTARASRTQRCGFVVLITSIATAVRGILSKIADNPPIRILPIMTFCVAVSANAFWDIVSRIPTCLSAAMDNSMPTKKYRLDISVF